MTNRQSEVDSWWARRLGLPPALRQVTADRPLRADGDLRPGGPLAAAATRVGPASGARSGAVIDGLVIDLEHQRAG